MYVCFFSQSISLPEYLIPILIGVYLYSRQVHIILWKNTKLNDNVNLQLLIWYICLVIPEHLDLLSWFATLKTYFLLLFQNMTNAQRLITHVTAWQHVKTHMAFIHARVTVDTPEMVRAAVVSAMTFKSLLKLTSNWLMRIIQ